MLTANSHCTIVLLETGTGTVSISSPRSLRFAATDRPPVSFHRFKDTQEDTGGSWDTQRPVLCPVCVPVPPETFRVLHSSQYLYLELIGGSVWPHRRPLRICRARLLRIFADVRLDRAGAGRRSGSGWRQGRLRWGRPLLSRPRGVVGSGPAAVLAVVESAAVSGFGCRVVVRLRVRIDCRWVWMVVRFVCVLRVSACKGPRACACVSRVCPGSPRCLFTVCPVCPVCVPAPPGVFLPVVN